MLSTRSVLILPALLLAQLPAQQTFLVDAANGPGTHFTDLPPAVAVAQDGDTIRLRAASSLGYTPVTVTRGITILGEGGTPVITPFLFDAIPLQVAGLSAGQTFVMKNVRLQVAYGRARSTLEVASCSGRIHLENVTVVMGTPGSSVRGEYSAPGGVFDACAAVTLSHCEISGAPALRVTNSSKVAAHSSTLRGHDGTYFFFGYTQSSTGAEVVASSLTLAATTVRAGVGQQLSSARAALTAAGGTLTLGVGSTLVAGAGNGAASAVLGRGTLRRDPLAVLTPVGGAAPVGGAIAVTVADVPSLAATGAPPGGIMQTSLFSPANHLVVLLASAPLLPLQAPPFGELWLDPLGIYYVAAALQGASGRWDHSFPISSFAARGLPIALQGASGPGLDLLLTTPCVVVLH